MSGEFIVHLSGRADVLRFRQLSPETAKKRAAEICQSDREARFFVGSEQIEVDEVAVRDSYPRHSPAVLTIQLAGRAEPLQITLPRTVAPHRIREFEYADQEARFFIDGHAVKRPRADTSDEDATADPSPVVSTPPAAQTHAHVVTVAPSRPAIPLPPSTNPAAYAMHPDDRPLTVRESFALCERLLTSTAQTAGKIINDTIARTSEEGRRLLDAQLIIANQAAQQAKDFSGLVTELTAASAKERLAFAQISAAEHKLQIRQQRELAAAQREAEEDRRPSWGLVACEAVVALSRMLTEESSVVDPNSHENN